MTIVADEELYLRVKAQSEKTGIPFSVVVRRALEHWVATGEIAPIAQQSEENQTDQD